MAASERPRLRADLEKDYGNRVRVRVGALIFDDATRPSAVLLAEHEGLWGEDYFWTPPGGGVHFGESLGEALTREVHEETGLEVSAGRLHYVLEFIRPPLHAVSFYFGAHVAGGAVSTGSDPERGSRQLIRSVRFVPFDELPGVTLYPEGLSERVPRDAAAGFADGTQYLGLLR